MCVYADLLLENRENIPFFINKILFLIPCFLFMFLFLYNLDLQIFALLTILVGRDCTNFLKVLKFVINIS